MYKNYVYENEIAFQVIKILFESFENAKFVLRYQFFLTLPWLQLC
jgi:hypothetical protein